MLFADRVAEPSHTPVKLSSGKLTKEFRRHLQYRNVVDITLLLENQDSTSVQLVLSYHICVVRHHLYLMRCIRSSRRLSMKSKMFHAEPRS